MPSLTSIKLAELRQHELRADAARARLAAEAGRGRRRRAVDWRDHVTRRWRRRHAATAPAGMTPPARSVAFDEFAAKLAAEGAAAIRGELSQFAACAAAGGATPTLLSILVDDDQADVARQRAFGRIVAELASQVPGSAREGSGKSDAA